MIDVELSLNALEKHVRAIEGCADTDRRLGHVIALARLLRDDRVLSSALRDLQLDPLAADAQRVAEIAKALAASVDDSFHNLAVDYQRPALTAWKAIVDGDPFTGKASSGEDLKSLLFRLRLGRAEPTQAAFTPKDVLTFAEKTLVPLRKRLEGLHGQLPSVAYHLEKLQRFADQYRSLSGFELLCKSGAVASIADRFASLLTDWESRLQAGPDDENWALPDDGGLHRDARTIASRIETALAGRRSQRLVLFRAKVYFEHFFYDETRAAISEEETRVNRIIAQSGKAKARRESILRRPLDRFIFQEGFFPVTELAASRGRLDLFLSRAENAGVRPLVAEIKQAVRITPDDVGRADVKDAIDGARAEISRYVGHLRALPRWVNVEPIVVVFHSSKEDVTSLEDDSTLLIDIGTRTPSQVAPFVVTPPADNPST